MKWLRFMQTRFHLDFDRSSLWNSLFLSFSSPVHVLLWRFPASVSNSPPFYASMVPWKALWFLLQECSTRELCKQKPFGECLVGAGLPRPSHSLPFSTFMIRSLAPSRIHVEFIVGDQLPGLDVFQERLGCHFRPMSYICWLMDASTLPTENHPEVSHSGCAM